MNRHTGTSAYPSRARFSGKIALFFFVLFGINSCGDCKLREYLTADSLIYGSAPVYVDSTGYAEVTIVTDFGYPQLVVHYSCDEADVHKLKKLNAELIINGKIIPADEETFFAGYANSSVAFPLAQAFDSLPQQLGITDSSSYMESFSVNMQIVKKYPAVTEFPEQLSVRLTSESTGGNSDSTIVYTLRVAKDTRAPIRFH